MKTITLTLTGIQNYWHHSGLVDIVARRSGWNEMKVKNFLAENQVLHFNKITEPDAAGILKEIERAGFTIELLETKAGIMGALHAQRSGDSNLLGEIKAQLKEIREEPLYAVQSQLREILEKLNRLEVQQSAAQPKKTLDHDPVYQRLTAPSDVIKPEEEPKPSRPAFEMLKAASPKPMWAPEEKKTSAEANIGQYWLSRIGIFTLLLGVVFLITYTSQFLGAWGKLTIGASAGAVLAVAGNFLAQREKYRRWAMSAIGGGWAILYFTTFAGYHVPLVKVIQDPYTGFLVLLVAAIGSISQALKYRSQALVFMSYFLAYFATVSTTITLFSLVASLLLAVSLLILTRKLGWNWLAVFGMAAVYIIHLLWLEPSLYGIRQSFVGSENLPEMLFLPWFGGNWRIYPMPNAEKSVIHLAFLFTYWALFGLMNVFRPKDQKSPRSLIAMAVINNAVFLLSFMHHLHVYYPAFKWAFSLSTAMILFVFSAFENKRKETLLSDIYLAFSVSLFCLTAPLCLSGASVTYGWSAAAVSLIWLSFRYGRFVLRVIGWVMALFVLCRIFQFDYAQRNVLFTVILPVYPFFLTALVAAASFLGIHIVYCRHEDQAASQEAKFFKGTSLIVAALLAGWAFLMGGFRDIASFTSIMIGCGLLTWGVASRSLLYRQAALALLLCAAARILMVDGRYALSLMFSQPAVFLRHVSVVAAVACLLGQAEYFRRCRAQTNQDAWNFPGLAVTAAVLFMVLVSDSSLNFVRSMIWGAAAFASIVTGFASKEKLYRWIGLSMFGCVLVRLFVFDFAQMDIIYRIISFIGLGIVFIVASFIYNYYSKVLLDKTES
ncbi:MAG: DUF2339 domain-containing protein [Candidatus Omnitrophota bacterium]|jgi:uncharacterized membrane protein